MNSKKEDVIKAAKELFTEYGYYKVSMDEIAKKSKVTKKTIYTYFKDKNDLIKYFLNEELKQMEKQCDRIDKKDIPFEDKIHELITIQLDFRNESKLLGAFLKELEQGKLKIDKETENLLTRTIQEGLKIRLDKAIDEGHIKECDTEIVSFLIYKMYVAIMFELDKPIDKKTITENIINVLKAWLLK